MHSAPVNEERGADGGGSLWGSVGEALSGASSRDRKRCPRQGGARHVRISSKGGSQNVFLFEFMGARTDSARNRVEGGVAVPSGDAQRVWFPEMLEVLTAEWSPSTTWDEFIELCRRVTVLRTELRRSRGIQAPLWKCRMCGSESRAEIKGVSVRSALFALQKAGAISDADFRRLERGWGKERAARGLDPLGQAKEVRLAPVPESCCRAHGQ